MRTRDDHEELGRDLKAASAALRRFLVANEGKEDADARVAIKLLKEIYSARSRLDEHVCRLAPRDDDTVLNIYFGQ